MTNGRAEQTNAGLDQLYSCKTRGMALFNTALLLLVPAPAVAWDQLCRRSASSLDTAHFPNAFSLFMVPSCQGWQKHPVAGVNSLLLWNVCVLFWGLSLLQNSTWVSAWS